MQILIYKGNKEMNWLESLQESINYIENHLLDKNMTSASEIANEIYSSEYNFRKIFSVITGFTVGEYIRNRRLSLAGEELITNDISVLDLALKYGYDTPESFTKAFTRFHGVTPSYVRKNKCGLKNFTRVVLKVDVGGGNILDYSVVELDKLRIVGYSKVFGNHEFEENNKLIPTFVKACYDADFDGMMAMATDSIFGESILGYRNEVEGELCYTIGVYSERMDIDGKYNVMEVPAGKWLRFRCETPTSEGMQKLWYRIYTEFMPFSAYRFADSVTLEASCGLDGAKETYLYMPLIESN